MSRLIDYYSGDQKMVVGRAPVMNPVSVNVGFALMGQVITGYSPIVQRVQTGYKTVTTQQTISLGGPYALVSFFRRRTYTITTSKQVPVYQNLVTGYRPNYAPVYGAFTY